MSIKRYSLVGVLNTLSGISIIFIAKWLGVSDLGSNLIGYLCGLIISFQLNSKWTFQYSGNQLKAFISFITVILFAYLVNLAVVMSLINNTQINTFLAQCAGVLPYTLIVYLGSKYFAFSN